MKKPRLLTPEEREQWRLSNQHTVVKKGAVVTDADDAAAVAKPISTKPLPSRPLPVARPAPAASKRPLTALTAREAKRVFKPYGAVQATLDLHGLTKIEAYGRVQHFIGRCQKAGHRHIAIITGKGRSGEAGVLRTALPHWLNEPAIRPMVSAFAHARAEKGGHGVTHVLVKRAS